MMFVVLLLPGVNALRVKHHKQHNIDFVFSFPYEIYTFYAVVK